jgi:DNA (cytosine-5)-methyltransferase 1
VVDIVRYFSMFTGVGGFELGFEGPPKAGPERASPDPNEEQRHRKSLYPANNRECLSKWWGSRAGNGQERNLQDSEAVEYTCVGVSEIDKYANQVLRYRYPGVRNYGDATRIEPEELPDFEVLCGGFPCQSFSVAGKRMGFEDTRGTLFFDIARIAKRKRPQLLFLENVKGLLSHDNGRTFAVILSTLDELGYDVEWEVLNSKHFGVPQNRERVFIIGHSREGRWAKVFPLGTGSQEPETIQRAPGEESNGIQGELHRADGDDGGSQGRREGSERLSQSTIMGWSKSHRTGSSESDKRRSNYGEIEQRVKIGEFNTLSGGEGCGNQSSLNLVESDSRIRRLTPIECERLQGFPDNWTKYGLDAFNQKVEISEAQRYKMMGNAVTVNTIKAIVDRLRELNGTLRGT